MVAEPVLGQKAAAGGASRKEGEKLVLGNAVSPIRVELDDERDGRASGHIIDGDRGLVLGAVVCIE